MKEIIPVLWDDLVLREESKKVPADVTVRLAYNGRETELDLSSEHAKELAEFLERYLSAGSQPVSDHRGPAFKAMDPGRLSYLRNLRKWASQEGLNYTTSTGKLYYPVRLIAAYDAYLAGKPWREVYEGQVRKT